MVPSRQPTSDRPGQSGSTEIPTNCSDEGTATALAEIFFPPEGTFCAFEPAFNVPYRLLHMVEARVQKLQETLDWAWRFANIVQQGDPWIKPGLRSAMVGDVFFVNSEAHAVMVIGLAIRASVAVFSYIRSDDCAQQGVFAAFLAT